MNDFEMKDLAGAAQRYGFWFQSDDGARLFALDLGRGRPIVFLHDGLVGPAQR
jgi:hypothetical protein